MNFEHLREALTKRGLDICQEMNTSWYNNIRPNPERLVGFPENRRGVLIGNSKLVWPHFQAWHKQTSQNNTLQLQHPFDDFIRAQLQAALGEIPHVPMDIFYVQEGGDRLVAFQRLAQTAGICTFNNDIHLCIHPTFGPWFGLRALLVFDEHSPLDALMPPQPPVIVLDPEEVAESVKCLEAALKTSDWRMWAQMRQCITYGQEHKYSKSQLEYHHSKNQGVLYDQQEDDTE